MNLSNEKQICKYFDLKNYDEYVGFIKGFDWFLAKEAFRHYQDIERIDADRAELSVFIDTPLVASKDIFIRVK